jgi:hypothetical protein
MKSNVVPFRQAKEESKVLGYKISFYEEKEIDLTLLCVNYYSTRPDKYTRETIKALDPRFICKCLEGALIQKLLSNDNTAIIKNVLLNFEEVVDAAI